jgi:DNA polymerase-3 subunit delta
MRCVINLVKNRAMLPASLNKIPAPIYLLSSNEPLLVRDWLDQARQALRQNDFEDIQTVNTESGFDWNSLLEESGMLSLFSMKKCRVIMINSGKPGQKGGKAIQAICDRSPEDMVFIFVIPLLDRATKNSSWFKCLQKVAEISELKVPGNHQLVAWIVQRASSKSLIIDNQSASLLAECTEGNLLAADQELDKLSLRFFEQNSVSFDEVEQTIAQSSRYNNFVLVDACLGGKVQRAIKILDSLKEEGYVTVQLRWSIQSALEQLMRLQQAKNIGRIRSKVWQELRIWNSKQGLFESALKRLNAYQIESLLQSCATLDRINKGQQHDDFPDRDWFLLKTIVCGFCGLKSIFQLEQES